MIPQNFTQKSQEALQNASMIANQNGQPQIEPPHLFFALLEQEDGTVVSVLKKLNVNLEELKTQVQNMINQLDVDPIMLHVRRGDPNLVDPRGFKWAYVNCSDQHPVQPLEYYEKALAQFDDEQPVIVFSDSPEWVKEQEFFAGDRFFISEPEEKYEDGSYTPYIDLCLMSLCSHAIIANSSMSWWGAWLQSNPNKKVIAPKMWFGPAYADKDTKDLYCSDWIVL